MNAFKERACRRFLAIAGFASIVAIGPAGAQSEPPLRAILQRNAIYNRVLAPQLLPRHIATLGFRADRIGNTPYSTKYYKVTNISAEVSGSTSGYATAVNNDGRIAYDEYDDGGAYIVNHGGTFGKLFLPKGAYGSQAFALNENAEIVGHFYHGSGSFVTAWRLAGATTSSIAYSDSTTVLGAGDYAVNNHEVAVGEGASGAALFEGASDPPGRKFNLLGLRGERCFSGYSDEAYAINDAGEIVGESCTFQAVRFSLTGYAELLPVGGSGSGSGAEAINQQGDVAGFAAKSAFLYKDHKTVYLPVPKNDQGTGVLGVAYGINASDEIVGDLMNVPGSVGQAAFLYINGRSYDLNTLIPPNSGWIITQALGINDHGEIVGQGYYNGTLSGVSLEPPG
jgi:uncharacterized membrane protein